MIEIIPNWHPIFVHFTIAFLTTLGVLQLLIWLKIPKGKTNELSFMRSSLAGASVFLVLITVFTGWQAYNSVAHDTPSHLAMTDHKNWALSTAGVALVAIILYFVRSQWRNTISGTLFVTTMLLVGITGYKGGEVVYRYGLGVMSLPQSKGEGHSHSHGEGEDHHGTDSANDHHSTESDPSAEGGHHDSIDTTSSETKQDGKTHVHADGKTHVHSN